LQAEVRHLFFELTGLLAKIKKIEYFVDFVSS